MFGIKKKLVHIYIDEGNIWSVQKSKKSRVKWRTFGEIMNERYPKSEVVIHYYGCYPEVGTRDPGRHEKYRFFTFLKKGLGFKVVKKPLKQIMESNGIIREKGNMDVEIARDITFHTYHTKGLHTIVLCSGDSDFACLIPMVKSQNIKFEVLSSRKRISKELRLSADAYTDLKDIREIWGAPLKHKRR